MVFWMFVNIANIVCFTSLAIYFNKWWIVLFALLFKFEYSYSHKYDDTEDEKEKSDRFVGRNVNAPNPKDIVAETDIIKSDCINGCGAVMEQD